jgi:hypothetical protein
MGGVTATPNFTRPDYQTQGQILLAKQGMGQIALDSASQDLASAQSGSLALQRNLLQNQGDVLSSQKNLFDLYSKSQPLMQTFDAAQTSRQAAEFGMSNLAKSRELEQISSPATARMRLQLPEQVESATSGEAFKNYMDAWLKNKGISAASATGVDPSSTFGRSMLADASTDEGRRRILEDIALRQRFVNSQEAPMGGLDPEFLINARQANEAANLGLMSDWQQRIFQGAQQLGQAQQLIQAQQLGQVQQLGGTLDAFQQARMGLNQSAFDYLSKNMGEILNLQNTNQANRQAYEQSLYDAASQNAQSKNAMTGSLIGAGAGLAGAGIGAAAIII